MIDKQSIDYKLLMLQWALDNVRDSGKCTNEEMASCINAARNIQGFAALVTRHPDMQPWLIASGIIEQDCRPPDQSANPTLLHIYAYTLPNPAVLTMAYTQIDSGDLGIVIDLDKVPGIDHGGRIHIEGLSDEYEGTVPWLVIIDMSGRSHSRVIVRSGEASPPDMILH